MRIFETNLHQILKKCTKNKTGANDKETQIKSDIINDISKEEILEKIDDFIVYPGLGDEAGFVGSIALGKVALENSKK